MDCTVFFPHVFQPRSRLIYCEVQPCRSTRTTLNHIWSRVTFGLKRSPTGGKKFLPPLYPPFAQVPAPTMTSIASALAQSLPKPKYTGEDEELPSRVQKRGPRIVGPGQLDETQVVLKVGFEPSS